MKTIMGCNWRVLKVGPKSAALATNGFDVPRFGGIRGTGSGTAAVAVAGAAAAGAIVEAATGGAATFSSLSPPPLLGTAADTTWTLLTFPPCHVPMDGCKNHRVGAAGAAASAAAGAAAEGAAALTSAGASAVFSTGAAAAGGAGGAGAAMDCPPAKMGFGLPANQEPTEGSIRNGF